MFINLELGKITCVDSLDSFRPIDHERNDSGAASPAEMLRIRKYSLFSHRIEYAFCLN